MSKKSPEAAATTEQPAKENVVKKVVEKVHRLFIQKALPKALEAIFKRGVPARYAVIGREAGYVDIYLPADYAKNEADFVSKVERAANSIGVEFTQKGEVKKTDKQWHVAFTNTMLQQQFNWGARGHSVATRAFSAAEGAAAPVLTLSTSDQPKASKPKAGAKGGRKKATATAAQ